MQNIYYYRFSYARHSLIKLVISVFVFIRKLFVYTLYKFLLKLQFSTESTDLFRKRKGCSLFRWSRLFSISFSNEITERLAHSTGRSPRRIVSLFIRGTEKNPKEDICPLFFSSLPSRVSPLPIHWYSSKVLPETLGLGALSLWSLFPIQTHKFPCVSSLNSFFCLRVLPAEFNFSPIFRLPSSFWGPFKLHFLANSSTQREREREIRALPRAEDFESRGIEFRRRRWRNAGRNFFFDRVNPNEAFN